MAYQRNGFLEGIDAAGKLINIYHGIRDRQDAREWKQKEWDYKVGQDKKTWDFKERQQNHLEKHQTASLAETSRHNRATESNSRSMTALHWSKHNNDLRREREQQEAERLYMTGIDGGDSGITPVDIDTVPFAIKGSFTSGLGNYAAQKFGLNTPEGASTNGVFGLLDDGKGNVVIGYLDNANGKKRVHTVGDAMPKDQAIKMLKESGATDEHINILMGNPAEPKPTEADLTAGINYETLAKLKSDRDARLADPNMDDRARAWWAQRYKDSIDKEEANIEAQKQRNLEQFTKKQSESDAKQDQFISEVNDSIKQERIAQEEARIASDLNARNEARMDALKAAYPKASKDTKEKILEEIEAINWSKQAGGSGLTRGLSGQALVKEYRKSKQISDAQNRGLLAGITQQNKDRHTADVERSGDLASSKEINEVREGLVKGVGSYYDSKSGKRGQVDTVSHGVMSFVASEYGDFTKKVVNSHAFKNRASKLIKVMVDNNFEDPGAGYYFLQRHGGGSSSVDPTEITAISQAFAKARDYGTKREKTDKYMNEVLMTTTDIMAKGNLHISKFEEVFNKVIDSRGGN
ncbi:hypothetical protein ACFGWH_03490 [Pasteurella multocida]